MEISKGITKAEVIKAVRKTLQYRTARDKFKMGYLDIAERRENGNTKDAKFVVYDLWKYDDEYEVKTTYLETLKEESRFIGEMDEFDWDMEGRPNPIALLTKEEIETIMGFRKPKKRKYEYSRLEYSIGEYMMKYMR